MATASSTSRRTSPLLHCATQLKNDINCTAAVLEELRTYRVELRPGTHVRLGNRRIELYVCLYFLKIHGSWESFLESTFLRYLCGYSSPSGTSPRLLAGRQPCIADALSATLKGKRYLGWSPDETISRTQKYLDMGEPYSSAISAAKHELANLYVIRHRIAHRSEYAQNNFRQLVRDELGYNPRGMTPGRFLITDATTSGGRGQLTYLDYYLRLLHSLCDQIVP